MKLVIGGSKRMEMVMGRVQMYEAGDWGWIKLVIGSAQMNRVGDVKSPKG
jgi:hypothetical protein